MDIQPVICNIDPTKIEAITRTKAIMLVSLYFISRARAGINATADRHNLIVIEDAAQSFGAEYKDARVATGYISFSHGFFPRASPLAATATAAIFP